MTRWRRLFGELRHRALRDAERRRRHDVGEHVEHRQAIERAGVHAGPRRRAAFHEIDRQRAVLGHEDVLHFDVVAAGAAQSRRVPGVDDAVVARGQQEHAVIGKLAVRRGDPAQHRPRAGVDAAGELPAAGEAIAAGDARGLARREHERGADERGVVSLPDFVLRFARPQREHEVVVGEVRRDPRGRAAAAPEYRGDAHDRVVRQLEAADSARLEDAKEPARVQVLDRFVRYAAQLLGRARARGQHRHELPGAIDRLLRDCGLAARPTSPPCARRYAIVRLCNALLWKNTLDAIDNPARAATRGTLRTRKERQ